MIFGIIIQARCGSKRFPGKILKKIDNRTVIDFMLDRLEKKFDKKNIIVATSKKAIDDKLVKILKRRKNKFFRGSENNVLDRYIQCAKKFKIKIIIRLTSDCPLIEVNLIDRMKKIFLKKKIDYLTNTYPPNKSTYPDGSDIEIFRFKSLLKLRKFSNDKENKEHITNFFWKNNKLFKSFTIVKKNNLSNYKYSLDYKNELFLIKKIIKTAEKRKLKLTTENIVKIIKKNNILTMISKANTEKFKKNRSDLYKQG